MSNINQTTAIADLCTTKAQLSTEFLLEQAGKHRDRQFVEFYAPKDYSDDAKRLCLEMYLNGMGFRALERVTGINQNTIINWVRQADIALPETQEIPKVTELDELPPFVGAKK